MNLMRKRKFVWDIWPHSLKSDGGILDEGIRWGEIEPQDELCFYNLTRRFGGELRLFL